MDMKVNKGHALTSVEDSREKPPFAKLAELIGSRARVSCIHTDKKTHLLAIPPCGRFSPPVKDFEDSIEALSPNEGGYHGVLVPVDFDWFSNELRHGTDLKFMGLRPP
jgi:hypothetical protein